MAHHVRLLETFRVKKFHEVAGHQTVIHPCAVGRLAMISEIKNEDAKMFRQFWRDSEPVVRRTEQAVQDDQRRTAPKILEMKSHESAQSRCVRRNFPDGSGGRTFTISVAISSESWSKSRRRAVTRIKSTISGPALSGTNCRRQLPLSICRR